MNTGELITRVLNLTENIDAQDADYKPRRRRVLGWVQDIYDEVWEASEWAWKRSRTTISVSAGEYSANLPADFGNIPAEGGVFEGTYRYEDVSQYFTAGSRESSLVPPTYSYSLYNYSNTSNLPTIQFPSVGPRSVIMYDNQKPALLADSPWTGYPTVIDSGAGSLSGTFLFRATYTTRDGIEHDVRDTRASSLTISSRQYTVTGPDPGPIGEHHVTAVNIYRTTNGTSTPYYRLISFPVDYIGIYVLTDNTSDAALVLLPVLATHNALERIPAQYHHTVLLPGVVSKARRSKGDTRDWAGDFRKGLSRMISQERQRKSTIQRTPRSIYGMW
jgi:hypothetical protein